MRSNPPLLTSLFVKGNEMAWEWSHTQEAYDEAREILGTWDRHDLIYAIIEDETEDFEGNGLEDFRLKRVMELTELPTDILADHAWSIAETNRTCSNGGHELYVDRNGWYTIPLP